MTKISFAKKAIVIAIGMFGYVNAYAADTTITNGSTLTAVINDRGNFAGNDDSGGGPLTGPGLTWTGTEFVNIDVASSWWRVNTSAGDYTAHYDVGSSALVGSTTTVLGFGGSSATSGTIAGSGASLSFLQTASIVSPSQIAFSVTFTNLSTSALTGLQYSVGIDPDQAGSGKNSTYNTILAQGAYAAVRAWDTQYSTSSGKAITLADTTGTGGPSTKAMIGPDCCSSVNPASILGTGQTAGYSFAGDRGIMLGYDLGTLAAAGGEGSSVTFGYAYTFTTPVPEPEIYAMMAAGLGLMGFVARRRKKFEDAVV